VRTAILRADRSSSIPILLQKLNTIYKIDRRHAYPPSLEKSQQVPLPLIFLAVDHYLIPLPACLNNRTMAAQCLSPMYAKHRSGAPRAKGPEEGESSIVHSLASSSTPECSEPYAPLDNTRSILSETVKGLKEVASVSYASYKEWASPTQGAKTRQQGDEKAWYPQGGKGDNSNNNNNDSDKQLESARKALSDLMSPFVACHAGMTDLYDRNQVADQMSSEQFSRFLELKDRVFMLHDTDSDTIFSMDTAVEDEMMQMHRLTSWGTNATNETLDAETVCTEGYKVTDDDGHVIPTVLLVSAQKRRDKRIRKRVVRFDYPPISSLRECPRHDINDLPDLFFTEEELDEIEADRSAAICADDIEIVAVASTSSVVDSSFDQRNNTSGESFDRLGNNYLSTPSRLQRKPRSSSPHPSRPAKGSSGEPQVARTEGDSRLIKGVQIYLRERSTGKATK
jgi:hypothetical protein